MQEATRKRAGNAPRTPNRFLIWLAATFGGWYVKHRLGLVSSGAETLPKDGPYLILANHMAMLDFIYAYVSLYPNVPHAVVAEFFYHSAFMTWLLDTLGCIKKRQFQPDPACIRSILSALRAGRGVLLFPEGQVNGYGAYDGCPPGSGKMIKLCNVPVYLLRIKGSCLTKPKWSTQKLRPGKIHVTLTPLFTKEMTASMEPAELERQAEAAVAFYEYEHQKKVLQPYRGKKLAEGFTRLAYLCPRCGSRYTMQAVGDTVTCTACGNQGVMDLYGLIKPANGKCIIPESPADWFDFQRAREARLLLEQGAQYCIESSAQFMVPWGKGTKTGYAPAASGVARLTPYEISFSGKDESGAAYEKRYPVAALYKLPFSRKGDLQIPLHGEVVAIRPNHPDESGRWLCAWSAIKDAERAGTLVKSLLQQENS
ncbi:MAG: 1-acyl-sn-glycerol-3-phosphate acyltransferase [Eubacteriales bacterium]|nr:1-acyl-sn-glycerol-3-phosphate acyltransferase [Eubacteriales bacterium]